MPQYEFFEGIKEVPMIIQVKDLEAAHTAISRRMNLARWDMDLDEQDLDTWVVKFKGEQIGKLIKTGRSKNEIKTA